MLAPQSQRKVLRSVWIWGLRSKFAVFSRKTKDLRLACKSVFQKATSCARRRIAAFLLWAFLCAFCVKEKRSSDAGVKIAVILIIVTFKPDVLFLFLSCEREKEPKMRRRIATLFGQDNAFVTKRHKFAHANRILLRCTQWLPVRQDRPWPAPTAVGGSRGLC